MDVDTEPQSPPETPKPSEVLWFPDGNVVVATDTQLFKVHQGLLSFQSSVFKDMFELARGVVGTTSSQGTDQNASEQYEGLPLVKLEEDKGEDVAHLLRAAYERHYYRYDKDDMPLKSVVSLLILSTKYDFKQIRKDAVMHIARHYPMNLHDYEKADQKNEFFGGLPRMHHLDLLKAAFIADVDVLLPSLFYASSDYTMPTLLEEREKLDLGKQCFETLLKGREKLEHAIWNLIVNIPEKVFDEAGSGECSEAAWCLEERRFHGLDQLTYTSDLGRLTGRRVLVQCLDPICDSCRSVVEKILDEERKTIWNDIPSYFGFPAWDVLRTKMEEFSN